MLGPPRYSGETYSTLEKDLLISRKSSILYLILKEDIFSHYCFCNKRTIFFLLYSLFFSHFYLKCLLFLPVICFSPCALWQTQRGRFCSYSFSLSVTDNKSLEFSDQNTNTNDIVSTVCIFYCSSNKRILKCIYTKEKINLSTLRGLLLLLNSNHRASTCYMQQFIFQYEVTKTGSDQCFISLVNYLQL